MPEMPEFFEKMGKWQEMGRIGAGGLGC